ncbi:hypothetical protein CXG81DRAFT_17644 [Caulochytrium protostelioides]|uniref:SH3 domain-containing protein n=1 Tax=Caulochytrium protostelioides TaxID=1555241 RepID=A0A4P9XC67_9FUNG|nr:hypothetical protein CXG81DRAFT_17644 [Caulochytrium protostelioides]|eukprot:RKP02760.1 hypothetical protein CXG81DRAFT_17644 [Caulochytrium protostelioides]
MAVPGSSQRCAAPRRSTALRTGARHPRSTPVPAAAARRHDLWRSVTGSGSTAAAAARPLRVSLGLVLAVVGCLVTWRAAASAQVSPAATSAAAAMPDLWSSMATWRPVSHASVDKKREKPWPHQAVALAPRPRSDEQAATSTSSDQEASTSTSTWSSETSWTDPPATTTDGGSSSWSSSWSSPTTTSASEAWSADAASSTAEGGPASSTAEEAALPTVAGSASASASASTSGPTRITLTRTTSGTVTSTLSPSSSPSPTSTTTRSIISITRQIITVTREHPPGAAPPGPTPLTCAPLSDSSFCYANLWKNATVTSTNTTQSELLRTNGISPLRFPDGSSIWTAAHCTDLNNHPMVPFANTWACDQMFAGDHQTCDGDAVPRPASWCRSSCFRFKAGLAAAFRMNAYCLTTEEARAAQDQVLAAFRCEELPSSGCVSAINVESQYCGFVSLNQGAISYCSSPLGRADTCCQTNKAIAARLGYAAQDENRGRCFVGSISCASLAGIISGILAGIAALVIAWIVVRKQRAKHALHDDDDQPEWMFHTPAETPQQRFGTNGSYASVRPNLEAYGPGPEHSHAAHGGPNGGMAGGFAPEDPMEALASASAASASALQASMNQASLARGITPTLTLSRPADGDQDGDGNGNGNGDGEGNGNGNGTGTGAPMRAMMDPSNMATMPLVTSDRQGFFGQGLGYGGQKHSGGRLGTNGSNASSSSSASRSPSMRAQHVPVAAATAPAPAAPTPAAAQVMTARASYTAAGPNEMSLTVGESVLVHVASGPWVYVTHASTGAAGWAPRDVF